MTMSSQLLYARLVTASTLPFLSFCAAVQAQVEGTAESAPRDEEGTPALPERAADTANLEEMVVTARKREETLIEAPVVMSAVSAEDIENRAIVNLDGISRVVPQLMIGPQSGSVQGGNIAIRGIAGPDNNPFGDQAVSFNIDGVQVSKAFVRRMSDTDIAQVEVLKGPQALFFGKNSPAGIISIRTADPTYSWQGKVSGGYEFDANEIRSEAFVSGPITDTLGIRLAGYYSDMDGYLEEETPDSSPYANDSDHNPESKDFAVRGTVRWKPLDNFDAKLKLNYGQTENSGPASATQYISCPFGVRQSGSGLSCGTGDSNVNASSGTFLGTLAGTQNHFGDGQNFQEQKQTLMGLEINYDPTDALRVTSVSGFYRADLDQCQNYLNDTSILLPSCNPTYNREWSQELRLSTDFDSPLNFAGGVYYADTHAETGSITYLFGGSFDLLGPGYGGPTTPAMIHNYRLIQDATAESVYLQAIYKPTDVVEIDLGGRYSHEQKEIPEVRDGGGLVVDGTPGTPLLDDSTVLPVAVSKKDWHNFSPEATVSYRPSQTLTVFASYKTGFLSGGFNSSSVNFRTTPDFSYDPEKIKGGEAGVKMLVLDETLAVNAAAYFYDVTDLQVTNFSNGTNTLRNAGSVEIKGFEADFNYKTPLRGLNLHGAAAYNLAKYTEFEDAPCYTGQTPAEGCTINADGNPTQDLSDSELVRAPKWNLSGGFSYETALGSYTLSVSTNAMYSSSFLTDATSAPNRRMDAYTLIDSTIRVGTADDVWNLALIGRNLTNEHYWVASGDAPFTGGGSGTSDGVLADSFGAVSRGREIMLRLTYRLGS